MQRRRPARLETAARGRSEPHGKTGEEIRMSLKGKTLWITGASRGIGKAIALRAARDGANIVLVAKTAKPHPTLPGTIFSAAENIVGLGGKAIPCPTDIRFEDQVLHAVEKAVETFGGIDILVNNASALSLEGTLQTTMKRFDLLYQVNTRGTFLCSRTCLPHLLRAENPHILTLSPPLNLDSKWFAPHLPYTLSKYGMSLCTLGLAAEFKETKIGVNSLWPKTAIATAAVAKLLGGDRAWSACRTPEIMADAAYRILIRAGRECTGNFFVDEEVLAADGIVDLGRYGVSPGTELIPDLFI